MKQMKQTLTMIFIITLSLLLFGCSQTETSTQADEPKDEEPVVERSSEVSLNAVVDAVDYGARTFTLTDEVGNTQDFTVRNPAVPLENLKAGDNVTMTIYQEELAYVTAPGAELPPVEEISAIGESEGQITVGNVKQTIYTVLGMDVENRTATLEADDVPEFTLPIRDDVTNLENVKIGDKVLTYTIQTVSVTINE